ncbi:hypothetical protein [Cyclonatronum sp.]|uniref:hypothetical protein n=1 Tax=Cyclonatronum sp. TaxID=3024185 RepID=UPI0025C48402|nr:hypothetical protein [Cyclonatronum sp.]
MDITFSDKKLGKIANNDRLMVKALGQKRATIFRRRLAQLQSSETLEDLRHQPGRFHELSGNFNDSGPVILTSPTA